MNRRLRLEMSVLAMAMLLWCVGLIALDQVPDPPSVYQEIEMLERRALERIRQWEARRDSVLSLQPGVPE